MTSKKQSIEKSYIAIDLKSFYASAECADRQLDPLTTNLVVADLSRTEKTICLAVSPSLKAYGISGRARLFEVVQRVKEVNAQRLMHYRSYLKSIHSPEYWKADFTGESFDAPTLAQDPSLKLSYIAAPPRMQRYEDVSSQIYAIYLNYISSSDIVVYSIDEVFMDVTDYLAFYQMTAKGLARHIIQDVLAATGITATVGVGSNLYLAKIAMDIVAKHMPADSDGVRIAELNEQTYREKLWLHRPLTDFWRVGRGYRKKLEANGMFTMGDVARCSVGRDPRTGETSSYYTEDFLFRLFGVNAETLIDHAWGYEPCEIKDIKSYVSENQSLSSGQVLKEPYSYEKTELIVKEMTDLLVLELVEKDLVTNQIVLTIGYDRTSITPETGRPWADEAHRFAAIASGSRSTAVIPNSHFDRTRHTAYRYTATGLPYSGEIVADPYGRPIPKHAHGTENLLSYSPDTDGYTSGTAAIMKATLNLFRRIMDRDLFARRITVAACHVKPRESAAHQDMVCEQLDLFTDYDELERTRRKEAERREKEHQLQLALLEIKKRYGKNAMLKGMNLEEGATTIERNGQIGGHRSE